MIFVGTAGVVLLWWIVVVAARSWRGARWLDTVLGSPDGRSRLAGARAAASIYTAVASALLATGVMVMQWCDRSGWHGSWLYHLGDAVAIAGFGVLALAAWVWLCMWPEYLVAPPLPGGDGALRRAAPSSDSSPRSNGPHL